MKTFDEIFESARANEGYWVGRVKFQVAAQLQDLLQNANWTQERLAEKIGVKAPQVSRALSGENNTTLESLVKMGFALGYVPQVKFVPCNAAAEPYTPIFSPRVNVERSIVHDIYNFANSGSVPGAFIPSDWDEVRSSNDQRFALAA
jgi:transcriptional regulator with XRE-family HTH domain